MNTKKLAIFGTSAVVLGGILVYALGIYPPGFGRDGRGAIGQRNVYRAEQASDAAVNPNDAPVATADELKNGQVVTLQNGQMFQLSNGMTYQLQSGRMVALQSGQMYRLGNGQMVQFRNGSLYAQMNGQFSHQLNNAQFVSQLSNGQLIALNGMAFKLTNAQMQPLNMNINQMRSNNEMRSDNMQSDHMRNEMQTK